MDQEIFNPTNLIVSCQFVQKKLFKILYLYYYLKKKKKYQNS